jgi:hypothetical protein
MWARATRVEFIIVSVALLVLLLCSNPPKSGKADVDDISGPGSNWPTEEVRPEPDSSETSELSTPDMLELDTVEEDAPNDVPLDTSLLDEAAERPSARLAAVDARNCNSLDYKDVMYGEVTVRWIWNGTQFVPQKVCIVEEADGTSSVWSFDQQDTAVLSEVTGQPGSSR